MELPDTTQIRIENGESAPDGALEGSASFFARLWAYGGPGHSMNALKLDDDPEVEELIRSLIVDGQGRITKQSAEWLLARFPDPLYALSAAKKLQQRLLTFHRLQPPQQVVASILVCGWKNRAASGPVDDMLAAAQTLAGGNDSAQILVSEPIFELAHNKPGFQFNSKPVREGGDGGSHETFYELLWTDESTYGHLREAGQSTGIRTAGRYQIQGELGRGAMGIVYKAHDQLIGRTVALKTISIDRNAPNRRELIERLKREAKAAGGLDHPNIITIYDVGQEDDRVYLSMQFLEGKTLQALLAEERLPSLPTLISYAEQICSAVGFAHARGVIHRDLKPANLMLTSQGAIKVLDFGIAKIEDATLTQTGLVVGTPTHMAPEQAADKKIDQRTDIFALGSVFYELFTLEKPFKGDVTTVLYKIIHEDPLPPSIINPALPGGIDAIIRRALAKDPKDRFQSCEEMGQAFAEQAALLQSAGSSPAASGKPVATTPAKRTSAPIPTYLLETTAIRPPRRIGIRIVAVLLLAAAGAAGCAYYVKVRTGAFPPMPERLVSAWHRLIAQPENPPSANRPGESGPARMSSSDPASNKSGATGAGNSSPANAGDATTAGGVSTMPSSSSQTPGDKGQAAADNAGAAATTSPSTVDPLQKLPEGTISSTTQPTTLPQKGQAAAPRSRGEQSATVPENASEGTESTKTPSARPDGRDDPATGAVPKRPAKAPAAEGAGPTVEGFNRRDVPELLRQADAASGRGDYRLARYEYNLILKIDPNNPAARAGLRRVQAAEPDRAPR